MNTLKTAVLLAAIGGLAVAIGAYFFGVRGAAIGLAVALVFQGASYFFGAKMALAFARAQPLPAGSAPEIERAVAELSAKAGIPHPRLYVSPDPQPNAFAAGRDPRNSVICVNRGLIEFMAPDQVRAVLAHEIGHIRSRDTLIMTVAAAAASLISFVAQIGWFLPGGDRSERNPIVDILTFLLAPITATLIQLAISRTREYAADRTAAELLGDPRPMISALVRLDEGTRALPSVMARPAMAHLYIAAPFEGGLFGLFSTHPPIRERIRRLQESAGEFSA